MDLKFNKDVAGRIGINEAVLLNYLRVACHDGKLIRRVKTTDGEQFPDNYRVDKQHLITGFRYKRISMNVIRWWLPWISVPTIRNVIHHLKRLKLIDVKHVDRIVNDNTNCYATNNVVIAKLKRDCAVDSTPEPKSTRPAKLLHYRYDYQRSKLDPNLKPMFDSQGNKNGVTYERGKLRWTI